MSMNIKIPDSHFLFQKLLRISIFLEDANIFFAYNIKYNIF